MVKLMKKFLRLNGLKRNIRVINKRSDDLKVGVDITSRADVLVREILDSELLGEGLIPTLQHVHMLFVENPITVPSRATTYGQLLNKSFTILCLITVSTCYLSINPRNSFIFTCILTLFFHP